MALPEETFPAQAFVGMISDEIEQMRAAGHSDADTAQIVREAIGAQIDAETIARFYASPRNDGDHNGRI